MRRGNNTKRRWVGLVVRVGPRRAEVVVCGTVRRRARGARARTRPTPVFVFRFVSQQPGPPLSLSQPSRAGASSSRESRERDASPRARATEAAPPRQDLPPPEPPPVSTRGARDHRDRGVVRRADRRGTNDAPSSSFFPLLPRDNLVWVDMQVLLSQSATRQSCWAFSGASGLVTVKLAAQVGGCTHINSACVRTSGVRLNSAEGRSSELAARWVGAHINSASASDVLLLGSTSSGREADNVEMGSSRDASRLSLSL